MLRVLDAMPRRSAPSRTTSVDALYLIVRSHERPVSRDEAAPAASISRKLAAFHLDKLADRGLLTCSYAGKRRG